MAKAIPLTKSTLDMTPVKTSVEIEKVNSMMQIESKKFQHISMKLNECVEHVEKMYEKDYSQPLTQILIRTGIVGLDQKIGGIPSGQVVLIASERFHGKTSLVLRIASHAAVQQNIHTVIIDLQRKTCGVTMRLISQISKIPIRTLEVGRICDDDWEEFIHAIGQLNGAPILVNDDVPASIDEMLSELVALHGIKRLGLVVIDGLEFDETNPADVQAKRTDSMMKLCQFATKFNIAVVVTTQLNQMPRGCESIPSLRNIPFELADMVELILIPYCPAQSPVKKNKTAESGIVVCNHHKNSSFIPVEFLADIGGLFFR